MKSLPLFLIFVCALLASCLNEEGYTTSADARLRLERDTLALDTVLAGEATNTYTFQVFNPQKKTLRIAAIRLAGGAKSPFMVNVDGTFLANGVTGATELAGGDSLRVFVQLNAPASTANTTRRSPVVLVGKRSRTTSVAHGVDTKCDQPERSARGTRHHLECPAALSHFR